MESKSLSKKTSMAKRKLEQNCQHINKSQCPNTYDNDFSFFIDYLA